MVLFEMTGKRRNAITIGYSDSNSLDLFPKGIWNAYKKCKLCKDDINLWDLRER